MDDANSWDCSVCTFRNGAEAFKCLMCDVRKGTSTRKPRINPEMVAKQVARQQEQIKQQALKSVVKPKSNTNEKGSFRSRLEDTNSNSSMASTSSSGRNSPTNNNSNCSIGLDSSNNTASPSFFDNINSLNRLNTASNFAPNKSMHTPSSSRHSFKTSDSAEEEAEQDEEEVDENEEIDGKSSTSGRSCNNIKAVRKVKTIGPKAKLKNVDRSDVQVNKVTVNNITVVITEFKPKRKLLEMSENQQNKSPTVTAVLESNVKKVKESQAKSGTHECKPTPAKEAGTNSRLKPTSVDTSVGKKSPNKVAKSGKEDTGGVASKKGRIVTNSNQTEMFDHHHHNGSPSKKMATSVVE